MDLSYKVVMKLVVVELCKFYLTLHFYMIYFLVFFFPLSSLKLLIDLKIGEIHISRYVIL